MNIRFLGDALDHWKGSLFESLQNAGVLSHFAVDPLASDLHEWKQQDFDLYARLLKVSFCQVLRHKVGIADNRQKYFQEILHIGDLFLDPDTGVATGRVTKRHVMPTEVGHLLDSNLKRIVVVYQHAARCRLAERVDEVLKAICDHRGLWWCSYESGTVAMLFLSRDRGRTGAVANHFRGILSLRADGRIRPGE